MQIYNADFIFIFYLCILFVILYVLSYFLFISFYFVCFVVIFSFPGFVDPAPRTPQSAPRTLYFRKNYTRELVSKETVVLRR